MLTLLLSLLRFPRHLFGRFRALFAYVRMVLTALHLVLCRDFKPDVVFCDQISACVPVLRLLSSARIVFYCHFPDQLLTGRQSLLKSLYRAPLDWLEECTTGMAHKVLVNSMFTARVFRRTFPSIRTAPEVLYPSLDTAKFDSFRKVVEVRPFQHFTFLSINRYERKKNLPLAIQAFGEAGLRDTLHCVLGSTTCNVLAIERLCVSKKSECIGKIGLLVLEAGLPGLW